MSTDTQYDVFVVGGGINGCGIARDAAGRGFSVCLAEMNDFGSGTSSGSTKLIHGGLRYLEHYEFRLVREALMEREVLWGMAPHIIWPLRFVLPHHKGLRPAWFLRLGLYFYDYLGGRKVLPPTKTLDMRQDAAGKPLKPLFDKAFEYSDCWVNDARFVVLNLRDAEARGARIMPRTKVVSARRGDDVWIIETETSDGTREIVTARLLVNAAGPWVDNFLSNAAGRNDARNVRLVQGSHIVVKRLFEHDRCYIFQNADNRIIFAIPYEDDYTLIGTTDHDFTGSLDKIEITDEETSYLCDAASEYFAKPVTSDQVVWTYSAVRPLYDDGANAAQEATRDYVLRAETEDGKAPVINVFGGKITTYRKLAESMLEEIEKFLGKRGNPWTAGVTLPGGDFPATGYDDMVAALYKAHPWLDETFARRMVRLYGTEAKDIFGGAGSLDDLGTHFGDTLYETEVRHLMDKEWAITADDILWRRTKRGLRLSKTEAKALDGWLNGQLGRDSVPGKRKAGG